MVDDAKDSSIRPFTIPVSNSPQQNNEAAVTKQVK